MGVVINKLRQSARGQACTLNIVHICNYDRSTTVLAHLPSNVAGKATKSDDWHAVFACSSCHEAIDLHRLPRQEEAWYCLRAIQRTYKIWRDSGAITIAGDNEKPRKPSSKILPRKSMVQP